MFTKTKVLTNILPVLTLTLFLLLVSSFIFVRTSRATAGSGVTSQVLARGSLSETMWAKFKDDFKNVITDVDQVIMVKYTVTPGGYFGWHQHGGPIWVVVAEGALTYYEGDDPSCTPIEYPAGSAFMDPGNHTHNARNEGGVDLVVYATSMMPAGGQVRIDAPNPGNCDF